MNRARAQEIHPPSLSLWAANQFDLCVPAHVVAASDAVVQIHALARLAGRLPRTAVDHFRRTGLCSVSGTSAGPGLSHAPLMRTASADSVQKDFSSVTEDAGEEADIAEGGERVEDSGKKVFPPPQVLSRAQSWSPALTTRGASARCVTPGVQGPALQQREANVQLR